MVLIEGEMSVDVKVAATGIYVCWSVSPKDLVAISAKLYSCSHSGTALCSEASLTTSGAQRWRVDSGC